MNTMLSHAAGVTANNKSLQKTCRRCNGQMAHEMCTDLDSDSGRSTFWALRCIQCGDIVDEVILRNRSMFIPEAVFAVAAAA